MHTTPPFIVAVLPAFCCIVRSELAHKLAEEDISFNRSSSSQKKARSERVRKGAEAYSRRHVCHTDAWICFLTVRSDAHCTVKISSSAARHSVMTIQFILLISRQGKTRLAKWFVPQPQKERQKTIREIAQLVLNRLPKLCNFLEWRDYKLVFKRCACVCSFFDETPTDGCVCVCVCLGMRVCTSWRASTRMTTS